MTAPRFLPTFPSRLDEPCDELARRAQAGPRYTSYPPATRFRGDFAAADAARELSTIQAGEPISLYAHIPFCSQLCWYCGCNVTATRDRSRGSIYVDTLIREIGLVAERLGPARLLAELSLGGGSPNFLETPDLVRLLGAIFRRFALTDEAELGIELDPRDTRAEQIDACADLGFTRVSVGVQDFDPGVQQAIHRIQSVEQTRAVVERARLRGFRSVNVDLVYGLPGQTIASIDRTLEGVITLAPDRLAVFGYAHMPHLRPHQTLVERAAPIPGLRARVELLRTVMDRLADAGYVRIGLDHFARPGDPLVEAAENGTLGRNFQGYVVHRADQLIGVGASAISDSGHAYWQNAVDVEDWTSAVEAGALPVTRGVRLDADDEVRRFVITRLMCDGRVELDEVEARHDINFAERFAPELAALERSHLDLVRVDRRAGSIVATPLGHHLIRNICVVFDRYARDGAGGSPTI
jgi:oxygen-independent coproporphyrinogen III oxidase